MARSVRARVWAWSAVVAATFASWPARAENAPFTLAWSAPAGCPSAEDIVDATRLRLNEAAPDRSAELLVTGTVTEERGGFVVELQTTDASGRAVGRRAIRVNGPRCRAVEEPTALVLALLVASAPPGTTPLPPPEPPEAPPPEAPPSEPSPRTPPSGFARTTASPRLAPEARESPAHVALGLDGVTSVGALPIAGLGVAIRGTYATGSLLFGVEGSFEVGGTVRARGGEVAFQLARASLLAGVQLLATRRLELALTVRACGGTLRVLPTNVSVVRTNARPAAFVGSGLLLRMPLVPGFHAEVFPELEATIVRDQFNIRDGDVLYPIHTPERFAARLSLGLAYVFR